MYVFNIQTVRIGLKVAQSFGSLVPFPEICIWDMVREYLLARSSTHIGKLVLLSLGVFFFLVCLHSQ